MTLDSADVAVGRCMSRILGVLCRVSGRSNFWWARVAVVGSAVIFVGGDPPTELIRDHDVVAAAIYLWLAWFFMRFFWRLFKDLVEMERGVDRGVPRLNLTISHLVFYRRIAIVVLPIFYVLPPYTVWSFAETAVQDFLILAVMYWPFDMRPPTTTITARVKAWAIRHRPRLPTLAPRPQPIPGFG